MSETPLKKPIAVYLLAMLFVLAPLGNVILTFSNSGIPQWYEPFVFLSLLGRISSLDWFWLTLVFVTGLLLFKPHMWTWALSIACLFGVSIINTYRVVSGEFDGQGQTVQIQLALSIFITISCLLITFYARFPYLDRRAGWFLSAAHRYSLRTPVSVVAQDIYEGVTSSISISGMFVHLQRDMEESSTKLQYVDVIFPEVKNMKVKARIVEYHDNNLRLKFKDLRGANKAYLLDWLQSHNEAGLKKNS